MRVPIKMIDKVVPNFIRWHDSDRIWRGNDQAGDSRSCQGGSPPGLERFSPKPRPDPVGGQVTHENEDGPERDPEQDFIIVEQGPGIGDE